MENMEERGERGGVVLDKGSDVPGGDTDVENSADKEIVKAVDESGGAADPDGGAAVPQDGENDGAQEVAPDEEGTLPGEEKPSELETFKAEMKAEIAKLAPKEEAKPLTDEQWAAIEQQSGAPRQTIEYFTNQNVKVVHKLMDYIDSKLSKFEVNDAIAAFAKNPKFADATRYRKDIDEFLSHYDHKDWTNPALLERATHYARGKNGNANVQKARQDQERNKKVAGVARPTSPNGGQRRISAPALNPMQKEAAALMGGEAEYNRFRVRPHRTLEQ